MFSDAFYDAIYFFCEDLEQTALAQAISQSTWLFPAIEAVHLLGLALLGGTVLVLDLRLLGLGLRDLPIARVHGNLAPWFFAGLALMFATGVPLFVSEAVKCYYSLSFWVKMAALLSAITFTLLVRNRLARRTTTQTLTTGAVGLTSMALWFTVAAAGRWIGFS